MKPNYKNPLLAALISFTFAAPSVQATAIWWDGGTANWSTLAAWSTASGAITPNPGAFPGSSDDLTFNITGVNTANTVSLAGANRAANSLTFNSTGNSNFRANASGTTTLRTLTVGTGGITLATGSGNVTIGETPTTYGNIDVALTASQIWTNNSSSVLTVNGAVTGSTFNLTKSGTGQIRLNGANTYSGSTIINGGTLSIGNYSGLTNTSGITVSGGGNLSLVQVGTGTTTNSINKSLSLDGTLAIIGGSSSNRLNQTWAGAITLAGNSTITNNGNSLFLITTGGIDLAASALNYQADGTGSSISGNITGATGGSFVKTGAQDLTLTGTNNYTGSTTISAGNLVTALPKSLAGYTTAGKIIFNGGRLDVTIGNGTTTGFTTAQVDTLLANATKTSGALGINTANGSISQWAAFTTTNFGSVLGLTKLGTNTLTLDQANTYTGTTTIGAGTLKLSDLNAVSGSSLISIGGNILQLATDSPFSAPAISIAGGTIVSDKTTLLSSGITHVLGNAAVSNATHNFTGGANVNDGNAAIQLGNITNASGGGGTATFNPTTANLIIAGGYTGVTNAGSNNLVLGGTASANSLTGNITLGSRANINVTKSGNSVWTLSGNNSVSLGAGSTLTVSGGALIATTLAALPNSGAVTFSGGTLGARVGGAGWTTSEVDALLASATKTSGALGIDTTNGDLTQWTDFTTTNLGSALGLTKLGTGKLTLNSASNNYAGTTTIGQGTLELTTNHSLAGGLTFGFNNGTTSNTGTLDLSTADATFADSLLALTNSPTASTINIGGSQTLTINGNVQIGAVTPSVGGTVTSLNMTGGGTFNVATAAAGTFLVGGGSLGAISQVTTLDLTALKATTINTSATGTLRVNPVSSSQHSSRGVLLLAAPVVADTVATTTITVGTIAVGDSSTNNNVGAGNSTVQGRITLGTGLTTLNVNTINVGTGGRDMGRIAYDQAAGDLIIRAADGTSRATAINVSTGGATGSNTGNSVMDFSGHDADILVTSLNVGNQAKSGSVAIGTNEFNFGVGDNSLTGGFSNKLDVTNVNIGFRTGTATTTSTMTSKVNLSGGTVTFGNVSATGTGVDIGNSTYNQAGVATTVGELNISAGNVTIHNGTGGFSVRLGQSTAVNSGIVNASMNLTGGTTTLTGDIVRGTATGTVNSTLAINGASATLDMGGKNITNVNGITYTAGTLKNLGTVNTGMTLAGTGSRVFDQEAAYLLGDIQGDISGSGIGLTKQGDGTLKLSGTSSYTGATDVTGGKLVVNGNISTSTLTTVDVGATLAGSGTVGKTIINGTLAVGNSPGQMDFTDTLSLAGTTIMEIDGTLGAGVADGHDFVNLTGAGAAGVLTYGGAMTLDIGVIFGAGTYSWNLFDMASETGTFATISLVDQYSGNLLDADLNGIWDLTSGSDTWQFTQSTGVLGLTVIPEPNVAALVGGLGMLALLRRRRN